MPTAPLTPEDTNITDNVGDSTWSLEDIPYDERFENDVMHLVISPPHNSSGIEPSEAEAPDPSAISFTELPLPLSDARRVYRSPISGLLLTHPDGLLHGGPYPNTVSSMSEVAQKFVQCHSISTSEQLERRVTHEIEAQKELLRQRMRAREEAVENNARVDRELAQLQAQREVEVKIEKRLMEEAREKRERREKRKGGG
ncbi:hypothetical protein LTR04_003928 [Oleoguttula sp. CCFEE 6159]|nr:hypothetical protein LTR04_003928 [Oleoguttula sp. CCFEE 6159]